MRNTNQRSTLHQREFGFTREGIVEAAMQQLKTAQAHST
jgi:hypothetical protein